MSNSNIRELTDWLRGVRDSAERAIAAIDQSLATSAELEATREEREAAVRAQALKEFSDLDPYVFIDILRLGPKS